MLCLSGNEDLAFDIDETLVHSNFKLVEMQIS